MASPILDAQETTSGDPGRSWESLCGGLLEMAAAGGLAAVLVWRSSASAMEMALCAILVATAAARLVVRSGRGSDPQSTAGSAPVLLATVSGAGWGLCIGLGLGLPVYSVAGLPVLMAALAWSWRGEPVAVVSFGLPAVGGTLLPLLTAGTVDWLSVLALISGSILAWLHAGELRQQAIAHRGHAFETQRNEQVLEAARRRADRLQERVSELESSNKTLQEASGNAAREIEAANLAKDEFLATMSHEIRTPLNGIIPLLDVLRGTSLDPAQKDYVSTAYQSSRHLLRIIDDILDYSKVKAGKVELECVGINLRELLDSVVRLMRPAAEKKGLTLNYEISQEVRLAMRGDPVRLRQVLTNLVGNAIKFTSRGGVSIAVRRDSDYKEESELTFSVTDTGIGISPKAQEKLFQPFSQADASTTRHFGGTGLGLSICRQLVELMGGRVQVDSSLGKGSTFRFSVLLRKTPGDIAMAGLSSIAPERRTPATPAATEVATEMVPPSEGPVQQADASALQGTVLIAEDNPINLHVLTRLLEDLGLRCAVARNGQLALKALEKASHAIDLVLMDCMMPEMDGYSATRAWREVEERKKGGARKPIIAVTANAMMNDRGKCLDAGMDDYLSKPIDREVLREKLTQWLPEAARRTA